jgi:hypothetical protein
MQKKLYYIWLYIGTTVVEYSSLNPKIKGSNPVRRDKMAEKCCSSGLALAAQS